THDLYLRCTTLLANKTMVPHQLNTYQYNKGMPATSMGLLAMESNGKLNTTIIKMAINNNLMGCFFCWAAIML
ncbi:MAG: hypothetical protein ACK41Z_08010, partial [Sediminibacterium sp.]